VGATAGIATLHVPRGTPGLSSLHEGWSRKFHDLPNADITVPLRTLDGIVEETGFTLVNWLLIDVEGAEIEVLRGARATLLKTERVIVEVARGPAEAACAQLLNEAGLTLKDRGHTTDQTTYLLAERPHPTA
jgi:Methyltransferase FkbM domain